MPPPRIEGHRIILRVPREQDIAERLALGRDPEIARMFGGSHKHAYSPFTEAEAVSMFEKMEKNEHGWVIEYDGHFIGGISLHDINQQDQRARLAIGILDSKKLGIGLGREAVTLVLAYAFETLQLHRIGLRVLEYNTRAICCYKACGFVIEGIEREAALVDGNRYNDILMGVLAHEFKQHKQDS